MSTALLDQTTGIPALELSYLMDFLTGMFFSFLRVGSFLIASPFFGAKSVPLQIRIITGVILSIVVFPSVDINAVLQAEHLQIVKIILVEIFLGVSLGVVLSIMFASVALAGEKIATAGGLGFAAQVDPNSGGQTPVVSNILTLFLIVTFLALDGHLAFIRALHSTYLIFPIGSELSLGIASEFGAKLPSQMFHMACIVMLPIVMLLLLCNFSIGVLTRAAPTLNLFSFGFPITMTVVFVCLSASATPMGYAMEKVVELSLEVLDKFMLGLTNG